MIDERDPPVRDEIDVLIDAAAALYQAYRKAEPEDQREAWRIYVLADEAVEDAVPC